MDEYLDNFDEFLLEIDAYEQREEELNNHIDNLFSWIDFFEQCQIDLGSMDARLSTIELMIENCSDNVSLETDLNFGLGVCWIGAVAVYEGYLRKLLLDALSVDSLQPRLHSFLEKRMREHGKLKSHETADTNIIKAWFSKQTINDPLKMAKNFDEIFNIKTQHPDAEFCKQLLDIRNAFTHRGGETYKLTKKQVHSMIQELHKISLSFTESITSQLDDKSEEPA